MEYTRKLMIINADLFSPGMEDFTECRLDKCENKTMKCKNGNDCKNIHYFIMDALFGKIRIKPGDYIINFKNGSRGVVNKDYFNKTYQKIKML